MSGASLEGCRRFAVIHGHFYQPPRENPWLGVIERQPDAGTAHDWNERVFDESYRPNAFSRLLDPDGAIGEIHNNYAAMSFNFGPTLFRWLEAKHPEVAQRIIEGDRASCARLDGHGNALAQVYNHLIMPLASRRDQLTQIRWGKSFFASRFGRAPEGMWLAETAINAETARCLAEEGIRFTILSPAQAEAFRPLDGSHDWQPAAGPAFDTRRPYRFFIDGAGESRFGPYIDIFFFDQELSKAASFGDLLTNGDSFAAALDARLDKEPAWPQTVIIATDGETFGHHKAFGDMCLAFFFAESARRHNISYVNFGYVLAHHPPAFEVRLRNAAGEGTAWSCAHGVGRWTRDCGCSTGGQPTWNQAWRAPLRKALNTLQQRIDAAFEQRLRPLGVDPWALRDASIGVLECPTPERIEAFFASAVASCQLGDEQRMALLRLLEAQKNMLFAFTSCGWFFADITGIETVQNLMYACRALQLGIDPSEQEAATAALMEILAQAHSNLPGSSGQTIYESRIRKYFLHAEIVAFTLAAERIICGKTEPAASYFGYSVCFHSLGRRADGAAQFEALRAVVQCPLPAEKAELTVLISHCEGTPVAGWILPTSHTLAPGFGLLDLAAWQTHPHVLKLDMSEVIEETRSSLATMLIRRIYERTRRQFAYWLKENEPILDSLALLYQTLPATLSGPIAFVLNAEWNRHIALLGQEAHHDTSYTALLEIRRKAARFGVEIDMGESVAVIEELLSSLVHRVAGTAGEADCSRIAFLLDVVDRLEIPVRKNIMEDLFYSAVYATIAQRYERYRSVASPPSSETALLLRMLTLARRMNFSIRRFPLTPSP